MRYERLIAYVRSQIWAINPVYAQVMRDILTLRANGIRLSDEEITDRIEAGRAARGARTAAAEQQPSIAVIPVWGVISHRAAAVENISGPSGTAAEALSDQIRAFEHDPNLTAAVLDIDSPGGSVFGVPEVAEDIRRVRAKKPIVAVANAMAASAAYWIGSQASEFVVTPSGQVGSIGVYTMHEDWSENLKAEGIGVSLIKAGKYKIEANPFGPLDDEARAALQKEVDNYYGMFVKAVAKGRGVDAEAVRGGFGEGRMANARDAVAMGMADRVATLDEVLKDLVAGKLPTGRAAAAARLEGQVAEFQAKVAEASFVSRVIEARLEHASEHGVDADADVDHATAEAVEDAASAPKAEEPLDIYLRRMRLRNLELGAL